MPQSADCEFVRTWSLHLTVLSTTIHSFIKFLNIEDAHKLSKSSSHRTFILTTDKVQQHMFTTFRVRLSTTFRVQLLFSYCVLHLKLTIIALKSNAITIVD